MYEDSHLEMAYEDRQSAGDYDPEYERELLFEIADRHAEEDRIEAELCEADPDYAAEAPLRAIGG